MAYQAPTAEQARQFAELVETGMPPGDAVRAVAPDVLPEASMDLGAKWVRDRQVRAHEVTLIGGDWRSLTDAQRRAAGLKKHYNQLAYVLRVTDYANAAPQERATADKCREALEKASGPGVSDPLAAAWAKGSIAATPVGTAKAAVQ